MTQLVFFVTAAVMFAFGGVTLFRVIKQTRRIKASQDWPVVTALVTHKEVVKKRSGNGQVNYYPEVSYQYSIMGSDFNQRTRLTGGVWGNSSAQKALDGLSDSLEVRYNPENPGENSHVYDKVKITDYFVVGVSVILGILLIVLQLR